MYAIVILMHDTRNKSVEVKITYNGIVLEALPNTMFRVEITDTSIDDVNNNKRTVIAYLGGKMKFNRIRIIVGDKVEVILDTLGGVKGRIIKRY